MVGIIDYDAGNIKSVSKAVEKLGAKALVTADVALLNDCQVLILPGVGSFGKALENLENRNLIECINRNVTSGKLLLGICLGMQLLFDQSFEDGVFPGLGLLNGSVVRFGQDPEIRFPDELKIPHMGWNKLIENRNDTIGTGLTNAPYTYFVHSYYVAPSDWNDVVYYSDYGVKVPAVVRKNNVIGMQFHPEKSADAGMKLLTNFLEMGKQI